MKKNIGLRPYQGFISTMFLLFMICVIAIGEVHCRRISTIQNLMKDMTEYEEYTYTYSKVIYDVKQAMRMHETALDESYPLDVSITIYEEKATIHIESEPHAWDIELIYDVENDIFKEK